MSNVPQRNVYVREEDAELWDWAVQYAKSQRRTTSSVVMMALERFRDDVRQPGTTEDD